MHSNDLGHLPIEILFILQANGRDYPSFQMSVSVL